jgi:hypothetical protein
MKKNFLMFLYLIPSVALTKPEINNNEIIERIEAIKNIETYTQMI